MPTLKHLHGGEAQKQNENRQVCRAAILKAEKIARRRFRPRHHLRVIFPCHHAAV